MGPNLARILTSYWDRQRIVLRTGKFLGQEFRTGRGLRQRYPTSPMIFNIVVDAVVRVVLNVVCGTQEAQNGLRWAAGDRNLVFYANNGWISGRDHEWVQDAMLVTVTMFRRMVLEKNIKKTKTMFCTPGFIWGKWGDQSYKQQATGEGATFQERKRLQVSFTKCRVTIAQPSLKQHMTNQHGICVPQTRGVDEKREGTANYVLSLPKVL